MAKKSKKSASYRHGDLPAACLKEGLDILKNGGMEKLSLREIARKIGVSPGAPYKHYPTKEALLAALAKQGFELFIGYLNKNRPRSDLDFNLFHFRKMARNYLLFALEQPEHYRLMFTYKFVEVDSHPELQKSGERAFGVLLDTVEVLQKLNLIRKDDIRMMSISIWSSLHGMALLILDDRMKLNTLDHVEFEKMLEGHMQNLMEGIE